MADMLGEYELEPFSIYDLGQHYFDLKNAGVPDEQIGQALQTFMEWNAPKNGTYFQVLIHNTEIDRNATFKEAT